MEILTPAFATSKVYFWCSVENVEIYRRKYGLYWSNKKVKFYFLVYSKVDCYVVNSLHYFGKLCNIFFWKGRFFKVFIPLLFFRRVRREREKDIKMFREVIVEGVFK